MHAYWPVRVTRYWPPKPPKPPKGRRSPDVADPMTRHPAIVHAVPLDAAGDHRPSASCPCRPIEATDLAEPARIVVVHRHVPDPGGRYTGDRESRKTAPSLFTLAASTEPTAPLARGPR